MSASTEPSQESRGRESARPGSGQVVTRFAPSPTGFLHIGGARTALFNWLFSRRHGGKFLLRIEDTDKARSTREAIDAILQGMRWLNLDWDGAEYYQSQFAKRHAEVAQEMLERGHAYRCYMSAQELTAAREAAQRDKRPFRIESEWRECSPDAPAPDAPFVIRLKAPREGETAIQDRVQGTVRVQNAEIDDFVLLRSDGSPTYMLAVVVDDHDMGVTHIIRGDDHLNNAFRQLAIIRAMDWPEPTYAHVPLIHGSDGAKMSKRHGATGVMDYDALGILPEALSNYLLRLGWGHGDDEIISREDAIGWFDLDHVGRAPSRFDMKKLENLNGHYLRDADDIRLTNEVVTRLERSLGGRWLGEHEISKVRELMPELKMRAKTLLELTDACRFVIRSRAIPMTREAREIVDGWQPLLGQARHVLGDSTWTGEALENCIRGLAESLDVKLGTLAQPLRAALTGSRTSPGIFAVLVALGRDESLGRIDDALQGLNPVVEAQWKEQ